MTIGREVKKCNSDRYAKRFMTKDYDEYAFYSLLKCTSLLEISVAMLGLSGITESFQLNYIIERSTLFDANKKRDVFSFTISCSSNIAIFCRSARLRMLSINKLKFFTDILQNYLNEFCNNVNTRYFGTQMMERLLIVGARHR